MYTVANNRAYINGQTGKYDSFIQNPSVKYGRNAVSNHIGYLKDYKFQPVECEEYGADASIDEIAGKIEKFIEALRAQKLTPVNFEMQYMPSSSPASVDSQALMGASFEEMGQKYFVSVDEMNRNLNPQGQELQISVDALDLNKDSKVDIGEYATSILMADMLSKDGNKFDVNNINGKITNEGENALLRYYSSKDVDSIQYRAYSYLYQQYNLGKAAKEFMQNPNNATIV